MNTKQSFDTKAKTKAVVRLEAMIAAFHAGKLTSLNKDPEKSTSEHVNYDHMSEDTVYASL
ncbi:hypothetical protein M0357_005109 [Vibrio harveyi]|uniref:hypothetical protein n=1 Tax=Vibrio vulnificus TaxID=672 RepID=UPI001592D4E1|nr:hypothetical protein [Vibrio vulnificus]EJE8558413.1 hypothetical protein [Vibrio vulnificus]EKO3849939.1 hypothetical protein [Vibrio harveyi]NVD21033.1 hypothetical protein [Vibrio vulnificus]HDM8187745.1 hypothetical protein [Vibrio harveyi]